MKLQTRAVAELRGIAGLKCTNCERSAGGGGSASAGRSSDQPVHAEPDTHPTQRPTPVTKSLLKPLPVTITSQPHAKNPCHSKIPTDPSTSTRDGADEGCEGWNCRQPAVLPHQLFTLPHQVLSHFDGLKMFTCIVILRQWSLRTSRGTVRHYVVQSQTRKSGTYNTYLLRNSVKRVIWPRPKRSCNT